MSTRLRPLSRRTVLEIIERLADYVETIPDEEWYFYTFWDGGPCGAVGCALGHAVAAGFISGFTIDPDWDEPVEEKTGRLREWEDGGLRTRLGIPYMEFAQLFLAAPSTLGSQMTQADWADRARAWLREQK